MGIPTAHICAIVPVAQMVGSNRIIPARKIVNPMGDSGLEPEAEKRIRRHMVLKALGALRSDLSGQRVFNDARG